MSPAQTLEVTKDHPEIFKFLMLLPWNCTLAAQCEPQSALNCHDSQKVNHKREILWLNKYLLCNPPNEECSIFLFLDWKTIGR